MDKNKYNIEEVFKSELEDFEMEVPQNLWSNVSNGIASSSAVGKAGLFGGKLLTIATISSTLAVFGGILLFSNSENPNSENLSQHTKAETEIKERRLINNNTITSNTAKELQTEEVTIDPIIEKVKQEKKTVSRHYIINNIEKDKEETSTTEYKSENKNLVTAPEKATISTTPTTPLSKKIEIIEIKPTEITASISASPIGGYAPLTVNFSHDNDIVSTNWDFKDGNRSQQKNISHTFEKQGVYNVELTITNELGKSSTTTKAITILSKSSISKIPNIFTPNNDNINDFFIVKYENIESFNLYIYSKKGELVYETDDIDRGWNGNTQYEEEAKAGDYIYIIKANGIDGKTFEEKGVIKLAR